LKRAVRQQLSGSGAFPSLDETRIELILSAYKEDDIRKYIFLIDSGASSTFVYAHLHELERVVPARRQIKTANMGSLTTINEGLLHQVPVTGMGRELLIQLCAVNTLLDLEYSVRFEWDALHLSKDTRNSEWEVHYRIPKIDEMYILDIRLAVHEFGMCDIRCIGALPAGISRLISAHRHRTPDDGTYDSDDLIDEYLKVPAVLAAAYEYDDFENIRVGDLTAAGRRILDEVGPFRVADDEISARVHSIASSSVEESGPFDLVSSSSASSGNGGTRLLAAGGAGPVAGAATTPRIKLPKRKEPPTAEAVRQFERDRAIRAEEMFLLSPETSRSAVNHSAEGERANVDRDNAIAAEEFFLRSPDAKALFDETQ
jgi:hypothetical protein